MSRCCRPEAYAEAFDERQARKDARRYRRKGLSQDARQGVDFLRRRGLAGATVLDVGGGVGAAGIELVRAGAARVVTVELSPGYEDVAAELRREAALPETALERRTGDFVAAADAYEPVDAVVMNRVVCCYPEHEPLVGAAAEKARRFLVFTYPPDGVVGRLVTRGINLFFRLRRSEFRAYSHPFVAMRAAAEARGLRLVEERRGGIWHVAAFERA